MKTTTLLLTLLLAAGGLATLVPAAEAEQACTYNPRSQNCHSHLFCFYNRVTGKWNCFFEIYCLHTCADPTRFGLP